MSTGWLLRPKGAQSEEGELTVSFDGRSVTYGFGELDTLLPAYAASIHKNPRLGIPSGGHSGHDTATRGKRLVVLVGQKKAVAIAVRNVSGRRRGRNWTNGCGR